MGLFQHHGFSLERPLNHLGLISRPQSTRVLRMAVGLNDERA